MDDFAHGSYGDDSGVVFCGPPTEGFWSDALSISNSYIEPIFNTIQACSDRVPRLVAEWTRLEGWADVQRDRVAIPATDAQDLIDALTNLSIAELARHCEWGAPEDCVKCAVAIAAFLRDHLAENKSLYIQTE